MFRYFKGEKQNPFNHDRQNAAANFWFYEQLFEDKFNAGNFSPDQWIPSNPADLKEWERVLASKPVDKSELFKLWLFYLLMDRLPDRHGASNTDNFLRLYYDSEAEVLGPAETV